MDLLSPGGSEELKKSPFYQEILEEGQKNGWREATLQVLGRRFGHDAAQEFAEAVSAISNLARLKDLYELAIVCRRLS